MRPWLSSALGALVIAGCFVIAPGVHAETLWDALARAFEANPTLNAQRANLLAVRENVPRALAGYHPKVEARSEVGRRHESGRDSDGKFKYETRPRGYALLVTQPLVDGFRTRNSVSQAEAQDLGAQEALRVVEQAIAFAVVRAYVDVSTAKTVIERNGRYVGALERQLSDIRKLHGLGDVTKTDVAEVRVRLAGARAQQSVAEASLKASLATYVQVVGSEPGPLAPARVADKLLPATREAALEQALVLHPAILAATHGVDAARLQIRITEAELYPTLSLVSAVTQRHDLSRSGDERFDGAVLAQIRIPLYEGGDVLARTRQARHVTTQRQLETDAIRDQVRAGVMTAWSQLQTAKARVQAKGEQVRAAATALAGVREAFQSGDRTNYDVLNAELELSTAEISQANAERDRIIASYAVLLAAGTLDFETIREVAQARASGPALVPAAKSNAQKVPPTSNRRAASMRGSLARSKDAEFGCASCASLSGTGGLRPTLKN